MTSKLLLVAVTCCLVAAVASFPYNSGDSYRHENRYETSRRYESPSRHQYESPSRHHHETSSRYRQEEPSRHRYEEERYRYEEERHHHEEDHHRCRNIQMGCYHVKQFTGDLETSTTLLAQLTVVNSPAMTNDYCANLCGDSGSKFSLTFNGSSCVCLDANFDFVPSTSQCTKRCTGRFSQDCGSTDFKIQADGVTLNFANGTLTSTYRNCRENVAALLKRTTEPLCPPVTLGCSNINLARDAMAELPGISFPAIVENYPNMTLEYCAYFCADLDIYGIQLGTSLAGVAAGDRCACLFGPGTRIDSRNCHERCSGNRRDVCGGSCSGGFCDVTLVTTPRGCRLTSLVNDF